MQPLRKTQELEAAFKEIHHAIEKTATTTPELQAKALKTASAVIQFAIEFNNYLQKHPADAKKIVEAYDKDQFDIRHEAEMQELFNRLEKLRK